MLISKCDEEIMKCRKQSEVNLSNIGTESKQYYRHLSSVHIMRLTSRMSRSGTISLFVS